MIFKLKSGKNVFHFNGFQSYTGKNEFMLIVLFDGEPDLYDWDGSDSSIEEVKRYYKKLHEVEVKVLRYREVF